MPISLKLQSRTRWSARLEAVEVLHKHFGKIINALEELCANPQSTSETKTEALSLKKKIYPILNLLFMSVSGMEF